MVKKKADKETEGNVDSTVLKMMYRDYSVALKWAEYLESSFGYKMSWEDSRALANHISYLKSRKDEFWEKL